MSRFDECVNVVVGFEGGYSNDPADKGGRTNFGITEYALSAAYKAGLVKHNDITKLTVDDAKIIYKTNYWDACKCDSLPVPLDCLVFDASVNHGTGGAGRLLQKSINRCLRANAVAVDGAIGPLTLNALASYLSRYKSGCTFPIELICHVFLLERVELYNLIIGKDVSQRTFIHGWLNRVRKNYEAIGG